MLGVIPAGNISGVSGIKIKQLETAVQSVTLNSAVATQYDIVTAKTFSTSKTIVLVQALTYPGGAVDAYMWAAKATQVAGNTCRIEVIQRNTGFAVTLDLQLLIVELGGVKSVQHVQDSVSTTAVGVTQDTTISQVNVDRAFWLRAGYHFYADQANRYAAVNFKLQSSTVFRATVSARSFTITVPYCWWVIDPM